MGVGQSGTVYFPSTLCPNQVPKTSNNFGRDQHQKETLMRRSIMFPQSTVLKCVLP